MSAKADTEEEEPASKMPEKYVDPFE